ncbi:tripartite tricarboxylate transporter substrate binding protein [Alcanivorax marinus]|uniref:Tripartite tricarboxylate transporter substrate binding protein n=1 Tax=Alloalcanivorax marinus TaxID=1177169 RepID=A0A9Q3YSI8_9GAMM|nr:tripartite tricarboxylate transporter substrate binding protein [Alloalcanivorax marinus]MCC4309678.1 tripartite tricarboxylate transporter substrate binding protein [Alloalcanivorax marinus]
MLTTITRRIRGLAVIGAALACLNPAWAADYPERPVTAMVPFPAGGSTDLMARAIAQELTDSLNTNVVVDNRSGGAGTVGLAALARARADGYTIGVVPAAPLVNQPHMHRTPYDLDAFDYVCQFFESPQALAVKPGSPFSNLKELVDYAQAHPGELTYGSPGPGSLPNLAMEQFLEKAKVDITHVPFAGDGPGVTALMGGHVDLYMTMSNVIADRDLKSVAIFSEQELDTLPGVQTAAAQGYDMTASWWGGVIAPKGIPDQARARLEKSCQQATESERLGKVLDRLGTQAVYLGPADFRAKVESISETNGRLIEKVLKNRS